MGTTASPSMMTALVVTVTLTAGTGLSTAVDGGRTRFSAVFMASEATENCLRRKTSMMDIMSIMAVMLRWLTSPASASLDLSLLMILRALARGMSLAIIGV